MSTDAVRAALAELVALKDLKGRIEATDQAAGLCEQLGIAVVDYIANDGCRNAAGGIYATRVQEFAREVQRAFAQQNGLLVPGLTICRSDGRCQYAIDHGAEDLGHCPRGKCAMPDHGGPVT